LTTDYQRCAELIRQADGLLVTAGAGIGVDSGLPDFRGPQGFWGVYPALGRARIAFEQIANPAAFASATAPGLGFLRPSAQSLPADHPARRFRILRRIGEEPAARCIRVHQQRRRPVPESGFRRRVHRRVPRLDPSPAVPRRLP
jgi:NAD-dependent SIR2 family protein deacetylase